MNKVGAKILRTMESELYDLQSSDKLDIKEGFVYKKGQKIDFIRKRVDTEMDDNILLVSPDEIKNCIIYILEKTFFSPHDELIVSIAKLLGYKHTGPRIQKHLKSLIKEFENDVIVKDDKDYRLK